MALADDVFARYSGKRKKDDAEPDTDVAEEKPGTKGRMLAAALKRGDGEAIEEAILAICGQ